MSKRPISLWKFKNIINHAWALRDGAKDTRVLFYVGDREYELDCIGQFQIVPDVTIHLREEAK